VKTPVPDIAEDLYNWPSPPARGPNEVKVSATTTVNSSNMTVTGDGDVHCAPLAETIDRSAQRYVKPMARFGGGLYTGGKRGPQRKGS
jgi:hypothetical protein